MDPMDLSPDDHYDHDPVLQDYKNLVAQEAKVDVYTSIDPEVKQKNRFQNILPAKHTRVKLRGCRNDYINANRVELSGLAYIATQGPLLETTNDFWQMVLEQKSPAIVMLTNLVEDGRVRCHKYWPKQGETRRYGKVHVTLVKAVTLPGVHLRKLRLVEGGNSSSNSGEHMVTQIHFTEWPDFDVPDVTTGIRSVLDIFNHYTTGREGVPIVHCSAGVGRTGTFIAIHASLHQLRTTGLCHVRETVKVMRTQRAGMIQTAEQYLFVYRVLREILFSLDSPQMQLMLSSSGEHDEAGDVITEHLMEGKSFNTINTTICLDESQIEAPPQSPFLVGH